MNRIKVIVVGPAGCGKTSIANYLMGQSEMPQSEQYDPTVACRILENEIHFGAMAMNVELWDVSGDNRYEACWKAIMNETDGVLLVYNPDVRGSDQLLNDFYDFFVRKSGLRDEQAMIFAHRGSGNNDKIKPPPLFSRVSAMVTSAQSGPDMKIKFENFIKDLSSSKMRK